MIGEHYACQYQTDFALEPGEISLWFLREHLCSDEYAGFPAPQGEKMCLRCGRMYDHEADSSEKG